ncbi:unnamed protein product [Ectocarpus fasciculatus]
MAAEQAVAAAAKKTPPQQTDDEGDMTRKLMTAELTLADMEACLVEVQGELSSERANNDELKERAEALEEALETCKRGRERSCPAGVRASGARDRCAQSIPAPGGARPSKGRETVVDQGGRSGEGAGTSQLSCRGTRRDVGAGKIHRGSKRDETSDFVPEA